VPICWECPTRIAKRLIDTFHVGFLIRDVHKESFGGSSRTASRVSGTAPGRRRGRDLHRQLFRSGPQHDHQRQWDGRNPPCWPSSVPPRAWAHPRNQRGMEKCLIYKIVSRCSCRSCSFARWTAGQWIGASLDHCPGLGLATCSQSFRGPPRRLGRMQQTSRQAEDPAGSPLRSTLRRQPDAPGRAWHLGEE